MHVVPLIERKRNGAALTADEWSRVIAAYTAGSIPDYQVAALLMATFFNGLTSRELGALTDAMLESGGALQFGNGMPPLVDKHSTGGVGDKVSLVLAPAVAECGVAVPMMSGRGLGHTGGTLDKLEAIPGFRTDLTLIEAQQQVERLGCALIGQTREIAPADQKLYALRDATATVESTPLIAASIMSKKLAEGLCGLVLDIKRGSGAFLTELDEELDLASTMIRLGVERGCPTVALLTAMDRPLGHACGNALETAEAIDALHGGGPADLMEVVFRLGTEMLLVAGSTSDTATARSMLEQAIDSGRAAEKFRAIVEAQGGDPGVLDDHSVLPRATTIDVYEAPGPGFIARVEPREVGRAIVEMGGGRQRTDDQIDHAVGFVITAKPGDRVERGQPLASIHGRGADHLRVGRAALDRAIELADQPTGDDLPLISHRVTSEGVQPLH